MYVGRTGVNVSRVLRARVQASRKCFKISQDRWRHARPGPTAVRGDWDIRKGLGLARYELLTSAEALIYAALPMVYSELDQLQHPRQRSLNPRNIRGIEST